MGVACVRHISVNLFFFFRALDFSEHSSGNAIDAPLFPDYELGFSKCLGRRRSTRQHVSLVRSLFSHQSIHSLDNLQFPKVAQPHGRIRRISRIPTKHVNSLS